jgi:putrescine aminotransferase
MEMDVLLTGKALGGGVLPVSALIATAEAFGPFNRDPLLHTSTFAGNPLACAAVVAAIGTIQHEGMIAKAQSIGRQLLAETHELLVQTASPIICQVRGAGLLIGIEFREEHHAAEFMLEMMRHKVLVSHSLHAHKVVRLTPPATLTEHDIARIVTAIEASFAAVAARYSGAT